MKNNHLYQSIVQYVAGVVALALTANCAYAQVVAYDVATNGNFSTGSGGGYGFGTWTINTPGGGSYVGTWAHDGNTYFGLWNNSYGAGTGSFATRSLDSTLAVGETFTTSFVNYHLNSSLEQAGFSLLDSSGITLFSFWQQGGNNADGNYLDANGAGAATGFAYDYQSLDAYAFTLTGATAYTFTDLTHPSASFSGTLAGTVAQVQYFRQNLDGDPATGGGGDTDFRFFDMQISTVPEPASIAIAGLGGLGLLWLARRRSV